MTVTSGMTVDLSDVVRFFRLLADETRLLIVRLLALSDLRAGEIGDATRLPLNVVSYHLKQLRSLGLLHDRRSAADARDVYYHLDMERLLSLYAIGGSSLHPGLTANPEQQVQASAGSVSDPLRILFLCTHNSARSQLAEGILRAVGGDQVQAFSAGSEPTDVAPETIVALRDLGIDPAPLYAKSLATFTGQRFDYVITVCDSVREVCPVFPGDPVQIHWSFTDPLLVDEPERRRAFRDIARDLQTRIRFLLLLPQPEHGQRLRPHH